MRRAILLLALLLSSCGTETHLASGDPLDAALLETTPGPIYQYGALSTGQSSTATFQVRNKGTLPASNLTGTFYLSRTFSYDGGYPGTGGTCGAALGGGETCTVIVTFSPQQAGDNEQALALSYNNGYSSKRTDLPLLRGRGL
ncbi:choice-of-anchor D domain-containing protein [bacterium]|nr:choice-of-anchor D domain-containing protein [bacterium]